MTTLRNNKSKLPQEVEFLDSVEQDKIIEELESAAIQQSITFRRIFSFLFGICGILMTTCLIFFVLFPYSLIHEARFEEDVPSSYMIGFYAFSMIVCFCSAWICWVSNNIFLFDFEILLINVC